MPTADAYIQALQRRMRLHAYRTRGRDGLPAGWEDWFQQTPPPLAAAHADAIVAELARRPPVPPRPAAGDPGPWRAFAALWRQQWEPADPEDRPLRMFAGGFSLVWHVLLFFAMLWLLLTGHVPSTATRLGDEQVVQVEFIGEGTPQQVGGGSAEAAEPASAPAAGPEPATRPAPASEAAAVVDESAAPDTSNPGLPEPSFRVQPAVSVPELEVEAAAPAEREIPMPSTARQPLQVSEPVPETTTDFLLPPPDLEVEPAVSTPELQAPARAVAERDIPAPPRRLQSPRLPPRELAGAALELPSRNVGEREVPMPSTPALPPAPELRRPSPPVSEPMLEPDRRVAPERAVPMPERVVAADEDSAEPPDRTRAPTAPTPQPPASAGTAVSADTSRAPAPGSTPATAATTGPRPDPAAGGWPDPARADDWGGSDMRREGGQAGQSAGLFDSDGRVRLAQTPGTSASGNPPGTITEEIENLDRAGIWLRRPPINYEPTSFDRFWRPNETLLEEWVRRSVTTVRIPIPGSSKTIVCKTILLAAGGACDIEDPNMVDQPASARPPPDIPFKPELQEGNSAGG